MEPSYNHLLCATDFSEAAVAPVEEALRLAGVWDARLTVLHVIVETALEDEDEDEEMEAFYAELQAKAEERMSALVPEEQRSGVDCLILRGEPVREILRTIVTGDVDLVVIGSHGMSGAGVGPFGTTGQAVAVFSPVPVLVVKPQGYDPRVAAANWDD
jgi:nucleotide-binding universal stress UspA family protein